MPTEVNPDKSARPSGYHFARAAMWLGGSALFGSLALVLWNRRALRSIHEAAQAPYEPARPSGADDEIY